MEFKKGDAINLEGGKTAIIGSKLGEGGQGIVYSVDIEGKKFALKWYTFRFSNKEAFKKNIRSNIESKSPDEKFLWPLYLTEEKEGSFGYIMDIRPKKFSDFSDILNNKVKFASTGKVVTAALNIVNAFRTLHRKGLSYQDLNDGNFFIDVQTGDILICDNDNVTPDGQKNAGNIGGKPGYMAPEIVCGKAYPNSLTDSHSLAVILFKLFCRHDPLMGKAYVDSVCITEQRELELYGSKPVFIFNPKDESNRPVKGIHPNPIKLWPMLPSFLQEAFITSFCDGLKDPNKRLPENEWQKLLIRFRNTIITCPHCSQEVLLCNIKTGSEISFSCGQTYSYPLVLNTEKYKLPLFPGVKVYACHSIKGNDDYSTVTGEVIMNKKNPSLWGIKNLSDSRWSFMTKDGEQKTVGNGDVIPIAKDLELSLDGLTAKIEA